MFRFFEDQYEQGVEINMQNVLYNPSLLLNTAVGFSFSLLLGEGKMSFILMTAAFLSLYNNRNENKKLGALAVGVILGCLFNLLFPAPPSDNTPSLKM